MTSPLDTLKAAFAWEQQQMDAWSAMIKRDFEADSEPSEMKKLLVDAWASYFSSMRSSDKSVIDSCGKPLEEAKREIFALMDISPDYDDVRARIREFLTG